MRGFTLIEVLIVLAITGLLGAVVYDPLKDSDRPNMTLKKDDWQCIKYETRIHLQPIGKTLMPITSEVCIEYHRIGG